MLQPIREATRGLWRAKGFSAASILTLALAAGANAAILAVVYALLLKPLPYEDPDRLAAVWPGRFQAQIDLLYLRDHARMFSSIAGVAPGWSMSLVGAGDPTKVTVARTSGNLFEALGTAAALGRTYTEVHTQPGAAGVLVLSHAFWTKQFGADPAAIGRIVRLDGEPAEIVGVMPADFEVFGLETDAYSPFTVDPAAWTYKVGLSLLVGRLADGLTMEAADRDYRALIPQVRRDRQYPDSYGRTAHLQDLRASIVGDVRSPMLILSATVGLILLIAGVNVGTLLLSRAVGRRRDLAVRAAIGASRGRIARDMLTESTILALAGGFLGVVLARILLPVLVGLLPANIPRTGEIAISETIAAAVIGGATIIGLLFGALPVALTVRLGAGSLLRSGGGSESRQSKRIRATLVAAEIALALMLTVAAGLMVQTLWRLNHVHPGFTASSVLTLHLQPTGDKYATVSMSDYYEQLFDRLRALPGVSAAGAIQHLPFSGYSWTGALEIEGREAPADGAKPVAGLRIATPGYFQAMGQPVLAGRPLEHRDVDGAQVIVNDTFARTHYDDAQAAIGRRFRVSGPNGPGPWLTIAGVVGDVRHASLTAAIGPEMYTSIGRQTIPAMMVALRTSGEPTALVPSVREAIRSLDPDVPLSDIETMQAKIDESLGLPRLLVVLLVAFAIVGAVLAAVGVYGVVAHSVLQRRREIGIKLALGAERGRVIREVLQEGFRFATAGIAVGLLAAFGATRLMGSVLYGVTPADPLTYGTVTLLTVLVVAAACAVPAWRASRVEPVTALK
jgi:putative ABC transport system permease protein